MFAANTPSKVDPKYTYKLRCFDDVRSFRTKHQGYKKEDIENGIVEWISENADDLHEVSFRTVAKLVELHKREPEHWDEIAMADMFI